MGDISQGTGITSYRGGDFELGASGVSAPFSSAISIGRVIPLFIAPLTSNFNFVLGQGSATFARTNAVSTFLDVDTGLVTLAGANVARFEAGGFLAEGASSNLQPRTEELENAIWSRFNIDSVGVDTTVAPDGNTAADSIVEDSSVNAFHLIQPSISYTSGQAYTRSLYSKEGVGNRNVRLAYASTTHPANSTADFDLAAGTIIATGGAEDSSNIEAIGSYFRTSVSATATATLAGNTAVAMMNGSSAQYNGDGVSSIVSWGGQVEALAFASSYMPRVTAAVTRSADSLDIDAVNMPAPTDDYTVSFECDHVGLDSALSQVLFNVEGVTTIRIEWDTATGAIKATHGAVTSVSTSTFTASTSVKVAFTVDGTNQTLYIDGVQEDQDAKGTATGTATAINVCHQANTNEAYSHMKNLEIDSGAKTAAEVAQI